MKKKSSTAKKNDGINKSDTLVKPQKNGIQWSALLIVFSLAFWVLPFVYSPQLMDQELVPKFLFLSILFSLGMGIVLFSQKPKANEWSLIDVFIFTFVSWQLISVLWAPNFGEGIYTGLTGLLFFISYYLASIFLKQNTNNAYYLYVLSAIAALVIGAYGWYEFLSISQIASTKEIYEIKGFTGHKNLFVLQLFLHVPIVLIGFHKTQTKMRYAFLAIALMVLILAISLLGRAFMVGLFVTIFTMGTLFFLTRNKEESKFNWKYLILGLGIASGVVLLVFSTKGDVQLLSRYNVLKFKDSRNARERMALWQNTIEVIQDHPLIGTGAGGWAVCYPSKGVHDITRITEQNIAVARPHNDYLWIGAETGLLGISLYLMMLFFLIVFAIRALFLSKNQETKNTLITLIAFILGYLTIAFFDFPRERIEHNFLFAILIALLTYHTQKANPNKALFNWKNIAYTTLNTLLLFALCFSIYVGYSKYKGETYSKKITDLYLQSKFKEVGELLPHVKNPFYTIDPVENPVDFYGCLVNYSLGNPEKALENGLDAIKTSPYHLNTLKFLGNAFMRKKDYKSASYYYKKAAQVNQIDIQIKESLAIAYYNSGDKEKAYEIAKNINSSNSAIQKLKEYK